MGRFKFRSKLLPGVHKTQSLPTPEGYHWTAWTNVKSVDAEQFRKTICCNAPTRAGYTKGAHGKDVMICICLLCQKVVAEFNGTNIRWLLKNNNEHTAPVTTASTQPQSPQHNQPVRVRRFCSTCHQELPTHAPDCEERQRIKAAQQLEAAPGKPLVNFRVFGAHPHARYGHCQRNE